MSLNYVKRNVISIYIINKTVTGKKQILELPSLTESNNYSKFWLGT